MDQILSQLHLKEQHIENLELQIEHQTEQGKEL